MTALTLAFLTGIVATIALIMAAGRLGLVDQPGGRKAHAHAVPLVGGLAIFIAYLATTMVLRIEPSGGYFFTLALAMVVAVGAWDDALDISPRIKFAIQIGAAALMVWGAGVQLSSVGDLLGWRPIGLWIFSIPLTIFAVVGVVNSINMMDGLDGLGGSIALVAFAWYAAVAAASGLAPHLAIALVFCGAIAAFLLFNLRFPWQPHARAFLGDAGSLMIGFALGWFAIDLTQGAGRTFPPIAALWVIMLPLIDCVSLMTRRIAARKSPFVADRHHIHHYLIARGFSDAQAVAILVGLSAAFGAVGFFAWRADVAEAALFWTFFIGYFSYHFWMKREWKRLDEATLPAAATAPA